MPGRHVNDEVRDAPLSDRLQVATDRIKINAVHQFCVRFQDLPRIAHELLKAAAGFLRLHQFQLELWLVPGAVGSRRGLLY